MIRSSPAERATLPSRYDAEWRDPAQIAAQWQDAGAVDRQLLRFTVRGAWWDVLAARRITLLVTREYEHLVLALRATDRGPAISFMRLPHPSGLVVDRARGVVHVASTRNPNQVYDLMPVRDLFSRRDVSLPDLEGHPLVPVRTRFYPGCTYLHDLALIDGELYANAVGQNAVVRLQDNGSAEPVWWPRAIETEKGPCFGRNQLQLNSIAAGSSLAMSYFSASTDQLSARRPGHKNFPVDKRGVIFSGATRAVVTRGLTRPHSARLRDGLVWVANSGYGELGIAHDGGFAPLARLSGWTRGLCFHGGIAFVGTSRVIPRFRQYAPGLDVDGSRCGIHAVETTSGRILGSIEWPFGNQVFTVDWIENHATSGFPFSVGRSRSTAHQHAVFYAFRLQGQKRIACSEPIRPRIEPIPSPDIRERSVRGSVAHDVSLIMLSAMYENGGNMTHRFLDGHPQMFVYPFESQLGTQLVNDHFTSMFPAKYRWPVFALDGTPYDDYKAIIDEEAKVRSRTPAVSKFRHMPFDFSDDERCALYQRYVAETGRSRANNIAAFFRATFDAWKDYRRSGQQSVAVGYSPIIVVDADKILTELPHAHLLHVVRNPWSAYADTKKRPVPLSLHRYMLGWTLNQYHALLYKERFPGRLHIVRAEDVMADPSTTLGAICIALGLEPADTLRTPTWNGTALAEISPWGTLRVPTSTANRAAAAELTPRECDDIRSYSQHYLDVFDYRGFVG